MTGPRPATCDATRGSTLCVLSDQFFGPWMQLDGQAEVVDLPEAMEGLVELYRTIQGEHPDWDEYRAGHGRRAAAACSASPPTPDAPSRPPTTHVTHP